MLIRGFRYGLRASTSGQLSIYQVSGPRGGKDRMQDNPAEIAASIVEAAEPALETIREQAQQALFDVARKGGVERSSCPRPSARICLQGFRQATEAGSRRLAELKRRRGNPPSRSVPPHHDRNSSRRCWKSSTGRSHLGRAAACSLAYAAEATGRAFGEHGAAFAWG